MRPVGVVVSKGSFLALWLDERDGMTVHADNAFVPQVLFSLIEGPDADRNLRAHSSLGSRHAHRGTAAGQDLPLCFHWRRPSDPPFRVPRRLSETGHVGALFGLFRTFFSLLDAVGGVRSDCRTARRVDVLRRRRREPRFLQGLYGLRFLHRRASGVLRAAVADSRSQEGRLPIGDQSSLQEGIAQVASG